MSPIIGLWSIAGSLEMTRRARGHRQQLRRQIVTAATLVLLFGISPAIAQTQVSERATKDRPDDSQHYQIHVLYVVPADGTDRKLDTNGAIAISVAAAQKWFKRRLSGSQYRMDTHKGKLDVSFLRLKKTDAQVASRNAYVRDELEISVRQAGFRSPRKIYAVYYDGSSNYACGGGAWPPKLKGNVAALYLKGRFARVDCSHNRLAPTPATRAYWEFSFIHEILHTMGLVATCAKNHTRAGHTGDHPEDLLYAGDKPWRPWLVGVRNNDYYKHGIPGCPDLAKSVFLDPLPANPETPPGWPKAR